MTESEAGLARLRYAQQLDRARHDNISLALRVLFANEARFDLTGSAVRHIVYCVSGRDVGMSSLSGWTKAGWTTGFRGQLGKLWQYVEPRKRSWFERWPAGPMVMPRLVKKEHIIGKCGCKPCRAHEMGNQARRARSYRYVQLTDDGRERYYQRCALSAEELFAYHADAWLPNAQRYRRTRDTEVQRARTA